MKKVAMDTLHPNLVLSPSKAHMGLFSKMRGMCTRRAFPWFVVTSAATTAYYRRRRLSSTDVISFPNKNHTRRKYIFGRLCHVLETIYAYPCRRRLGRIPRRTYHCDDAVWTVQGSENATPGTHLCRFHRA